MTNDKGNGESKVAETPKELMQLHLRKMVSASYDPFPCEGSRCPRKIRVKGVYWLDTLSGAMLCEICGNCLKYSRKKKLLRGKDFRSVTGGV
jgi:hypothetical protein